jgi:hypothetical protein
MPKGVYPRGREVLIVEQTGIDTRSRYDVLEARLADAEKRIAHFEEYFARGYLPTPYVRPNR